MLYRRWKTLREIRTKAETERTGEGITNIRRKNWTSADDFQE